MNTSYRYKVIWTIAASIVFASSIARSQSDLEDQLDASRWTKLEETELVDDQMPDVLSKVISFDTTEGTLMSVDVSPDGEALIFDLLGDIYQLPISGGEAVPLTRGRAWDQAPRFSPDGKSIYFVSDRVGTKNVWHLNLDDQSFEQVTVSDSDIVGTPNWSRDGLKLIVGRSDSASNNVEKLLQMVDSNTGEMLPIMDPIGPWFNYEEFKAFRQATEIYSAVQTANGYIYYSEAPYDQKVGRRKVLLYEFNPKTQTRNTLTLSEASYSDYKPQLSHNGSHLAYFRQYNDRRTEIRVLNRRTGQDKALIELTGADDASYGASQDMRPNYAFTPDERQLIFWHGGKIYGVDLADGSSNIIPFRVNVVRDVWERVQPSPQFINEVNEAKIIRWPTMSRDGQRIAFSAIGYVWIMDLETDHIHRLTSSSDFEFMPALSPDGKSVAYISFVESEDEYWPGRLMVANADGGAPRQILAAPMSTFILPRWSEDSQNIAFIREVQTESGINAALGWTPATSGVYHEVAAVSASDKFPNLGIYARYVAFDDAGCNLLFSFQSSRTETTLAMASLDGSSQRTLAVGTPEVGGITPAPDLKSLALTQRDGTVWVVPFEAGIEPTEVSALTPRARQVSENGGYYVGWSSPDQITFGFGQKVFRFNMNQHKPESLNIKVTLPEYGTPRPIAFTGARLITMSNDWGAGPVIESGTIVLNGMRISMIGPASAVTIPSDAHVVDATGKTIMPGLLDVHYHRIGGSSGITGISAFKLPNPNFSDQTALGYGITTAWEPGGPWHDGVPATVDLQQAGRITSPRWSHSAMGSVGYPWEQLASYKNALAAVEQSKELGVTVLKEYNTPTRQQQQWLSSAAREKGLGIISHIENFNGMMTRVVDGYTGGDHPYIPMPFFKDVLELLKQTGYIWTPNIVITPGTVGARQDKSSYYWQHALEKRPREFEKLKALVSSDRFREPSTAGPSVPYSSHRVSRVAEQAASAAQSGVHIGVSAHGMYGINLHREMWYLWKGGLPIVDVLRAATVGNAEKLGLQEDIGSLEPGKIADILVLDDNPLEDILHTLSVKYTIQGGIVYRSSTARKVNFLTIQE